MQQTAVLRQSYRVLIRACAGELTSAGSTLGGGLQSALDNLGALLTEFEKTLADEDDLETLPPPAGPS
jgi:hypothetical protein